MVLLGDMRLAAHFHRHGLIYRVLCGFVALAFALGYFWGSHPVWRIAPVFLFALGAFAPRKQWLILKLLFLVLLVPTFGTLVARASYLWSVPYPHALDVGFEICFALVHVWLILAAASFLFSQPPLIRESHVA